MEDPLPVVEPIQTESNFSLLRAVLLLIGLLALAGMLYLTQSSQATMTGARTLDLQAEYERLRRENAQLEYEIARLTAPARMAERARRLGLRPATLTQTIYLVVRDYPVLPPKSSPLVQRQEMPTQTVDPWTLVWAEVRARLGWLSNRDAAEASP